MFWFYAITFIYIQVLFMLWKLGGKNLCYFEYSHHLYLLCNAIVVPQISLFEECVMLDRALEEMQKENIIVSLIFFNHVKRKILLRQMGAHNYFFSRLTSYHSKNKWPAFCWKLAALRRLRKHIGPCFLWILITTSETPVLLFFPHLNFFALVF